MASWLYVKAERPPQAWTTVLSVDGGGLRGVLPCTVLLHVENTIKQFIVDEQDNGLQLIKEKRTHSTEPGQRQDDVVLKKISKDQYNFEILLADYFELYAGTSAGSIISTYLSTRGKWSKEFVKQLSDNKLLRQKLKEYVNLDEDLPLWPGGAASLVATIWAKAAVIFAHDCKGRDINTTVKYLFTPEPSGFGKAVKAVLNFGSTVRGVFMAKHSFDGAQEVFQGAFGKATKLSEVPGNLLVTSFNLGSTCPCSFFNKLDKIPNRVNHGYAQPFPGPSRGPGSDPNNRDEFLHTSGLMKAGRTMYHSKAGIGGAWKPAFTVEAADLALWTAVQASVSAPTFFPVADVKVNFEEPSIGSQTLRLTDGGVAANNPSLQAAAFASAYLAGRNGKVAILSLGCGNVSGATKVSGAAGGKDWAMNGVITAIMNGNTSATAEAADLFLNQPHGKGEPQSRLLRLNYLETIENAKKVQGSHQGRSTADVLETMDLPQDIPRLTEMGNALWGFYNNPNVDEPITNEVAVANFIKAHVFNMGEPAELVQLFDCSCRPSTPGQKHEHAH